MRHAPSLNSEKPVSRQYELEYYSFYGWPAYWDGTEVWGNVGIPDRRCGKWSDVSRKHTDDPHLRSTKDVIGHSIQALDGEIGHVEDFVVDDETWIIRYLVVDTKNWLPGKRVLIATDWIERISWEEGKVFLSLTRDKIREAPEYTPDALITRAIRREHAPALQPRRILVHRRTGINGDARNHVPQEFRTSLGWRWLPSEY